MCKLIYWRCAIRIVFFKCARRHALSTYYVCRNEYAIRGVCTLRCKNTGEEKMQIGDCVSACNMFDTTCCTQMAAVIVAKEEAIWFNVISRELFGVCIHFYFHSVILNTEKNTMSKHKCIAAYLQPNKTCCFHRIEFHFCTCSRSVFHPNSPWWTPVKHAKPSFKYSSLRVCTCCHLRSYS